MRSGPGPGMVPITFTILMTPAGVIASKGCSRYVMPAVLSCASMYWRHWASAAEPDGRGPNPTCRSRSVHAREESKWRGAMVRDCDGASDGAMVRDCEGASDGATVRGFWASARHATTIRPNKSAHARTLMWCSGFAHLL